VFIYASTGIDVSSLAVGQRVRVIGFSSQFDPLYEITRACRATSAGVSARTKVPFVALGTR